MADQQFIENGKDIIDLISKFYLNELDSEWVKIAVNSDFTESADLPYSFVEHHESTNFCGLFNATKNSLRQYVDQIKLDVHIPDKRASATFLSTTSLIEEEYERSDTFTKFWVDLTKSLNIKSLLAFLFYHINKGQLYDSNEDDRELGIHSSSMYFLLLSIPGSNAFRVFHPVLYLKTLDILKLTTKLNVGASSPKKGGRGSRSSHRKSGEDQADGNEDEADELSYLSPVEANKLIRSLNILLNDLLRLLNIFSLKHSTESLDETINVLIEITRSEIHNPQAVFFQINAANSVSSLAYNAYVALQNLCNPLHGNPKTIIISVMKHIISNILMIPRGSSELSSRALSVIREHSVIFVKYLIIQLPKESLEGAYILVQHICLRVPDKADFREKAAKSVVEILKAFPVREYSQIIKWLYSLSRHDKAGHRMFTLEVIGKLITEDERSSESEDNSSSAVCDEDLESETATTISDNNFPIAKKNVLSSSVNKHVLSHNFLLYIIFSRCQDSAATVRSKALFLLSECAYSNNPTIIEALKKVFINKRTVSLETSPASGSDSNSDTEEINSFHLPDYENVMCMLRRRALDERVMVRKSALQVIESLIKLKEDMVSVDSLKVLANHCRDPALLIRKQVIQSLSSIIETYPGNEAAIKVWVSGVLPLILDPEMKVQEKVVEYIDALIFRRVKKRDTDGLVLSCEEELPWKILDVITKLSYHKFFNKVLMLWSKSEYQARSQVISFARSHIGGKFNEQAWTFLALVSQYIDIKHPLFVADYFEEHLHSDEIGSYTIQQVLKTLCHCAKYIPKERALKLQSDLLSVISSISASVELISPMINIITLISTTFESDSENAQIEIESWASSLLKSCDDYLKAVLFPQEPNSLSKEEEEKFFRYLFILGEVCQLCPHKVNKRLFLMMQSIIFHENHTRSEKNVDIRIPSTQTQSSQPPSLSFNPTKRLKTLAVITLGKMCLQHEDQAKRIIPALGKMLDTTVIPPMKINIIIVLSDMCVRYATLVDPLMPEVTACLRDTNIQVRKVTLTLLITLLQEDYLKLKGSFFYRILQCLCDEDEEIRSTVEFYMTERLLKRFPKIFLQHFIECIFHYNCYEEHESYNKFTQSNKEKELFSLSGAKYRDQRMMLYKFMLDHMMDDQRFSITQRLCQDVLGAVVDGRIKLTPSSLPMLEDTFMVLSCDEIKLAWLKNRLEESDQPTDSSEEAEMAGIVIKKTIISQDLITVSKVIKRNVIENIVPILIALKHKLAENRSPLMKQLLLYFKEIMKDYKNEVKEILAGDKQLAKEIEFDLRKLEDQNELPSVAKDKQLNNNRKESDSLSSSEATAKENQPQELHNEQQPSASAAGQINNPNEETVVEERILNGECYEQRTISSIFKRKSNVPILLKKVLIKGKKKCELEEKINKVDTNNKYTGDDSSHASSSDVQCENDIVPNSEVIENINLTEKIDLKSTEENRSTEINSITDPEAKSKENNVTPVKRNRLELKKNLMRAISTPNPVQKVISDITFVNNTQNISNITLTDTELTKDQEKNPKTSTNTSNSTLLLHFKSPEVFAKDEQFSRLRRDSQKNLKKRLDLESVKEKEPSDSNSSKQSTKRPSGGFMESYNESESIGTDESTFASNSRSFSRMKKRNKFK